MTLYWLRVRYHTTGHEYAYSYASMTTRVCAGLLLEAYATIVVEWESTGTDEAIGAPGGVQPAVGGV